jgi:hypothetical protein
MIDNDLERVAGRRIEKERETAQYASAVSPGFSGEFFYNQASVRL